jgi:hypothetical protein
LPGHVGIYAKEWKDFGLIRKDILKLLQFLWREFGLSFLIEKCLWRANRNQFTKSFLEFLIGTGHFWGDVGQDPKSIGKITTCLGHGISQPLNTILFLLCQNSELLSRIRDKLVRSKVNVAHITDLHWL